MKKKERNILHLRTLAEKKGYINPELISPLIEKSAGWLATGYYCKSKERGTHNNIRRQGTKSFFYDTGNIYILKKELIEVGEWASGTIERFELVGSKNYEIDGDLDFFIVEKFLERQFNDKKK